MKKLNNIFLALLLIAAVVSCDDYLDDAPNKSASVVPTTVEQLDYLLNNHIGFRREYNLNAILASDSYELYPELAKAYPSYPGLTNVEYALWDTENIPNNTMSDYTSGTFFTSEYSKIFIANTILNYLPKVSGSDEQKKKLEKEAKFVRAYSTWNLAQTYCLPYNESTKNELGLTIKSSTNFEESSKRTTLEETYNFIASDLNAALEITDDMQMINDVHNSFRASRASVNGFAARYWLNMNDYDKALQYANAALQAHSNLMDYNTCMSYYYGKLPATMLTGSSLNGRMDWNETLYCRDTYFSYWYAWISPSQKLISKYDKEYDLRYKYLIWEEYASDYYSFSGVYGPAYTFYYGSVPSGPSTAEMILIRAECLARKGDISGAMAEVNKLRVVRMSKDAPDEIKYLFASTKEEAISRIIDERMREMPFTERWNDIRRLNFNNDPTDDVGDLTKFFAPYNASNIQLNEPFKTYTLPKNSRRYAVPIPQSDIDASNNVIEQNRY